MFKLTDYPPDTRTLLSAYAPQPDLIERPPTPPGLAALTPKESDRKRISLDLTPDPVRSRRDRAATCA